MSIAILIWSMTLFGLVLLWAGAVALAYILTVYTYEPTVDGEVTSNTNQDTTGGSVDVK